MKKASFADAQQTTALTGMAIGGVTVFGLPNEMPIWVDARVMERALTWCQGKSILNSINLEDGLERFEKVVPLGRRFGAAFVVGLIDERGMAVTVERKLEVARRSYRILTEEMEVAPEDIWWDPLVFPCGTGDEAYLGSAHATTRAAESP